MTRAELLILFNDLFHIKDEIADWFPCGHNSIRIRFKEGVALPFNISKADVIFSAKSRDNWRLETTEAWCDAMKTLLKAGEHRG